MAKTLAAAISAHRIISNNPTDKISYGHARRGYCDGRNLKLSLELIIVYFIARFACDATSCRVRRIVVAKGAHIGHIRLHGAANH